MSTQFDAQFAGPASPYWMSAQRLIELGDNARACDTRAFLYHVVGLNRLYADDGFTRREDGRVGMAEYVTANQQRS